LHRQQNYHDSSVTAAAAVICVKHRVKRSSDWLQTVSARNWNRHTTSATLNHILTKLVLKCPYNEELINLTLQTFKRHLKTFLFFLHTSTFSAFEVSYKNALYKPTVIFIPSKLNPYQYKTKRVRSTMNVTAK